LHAYHSSRKRAAPIYTVHFGVAHASFENALSPPLVTAVTTWQYIVRLTRPLLRYAVVALIVAIGVV
jgi:hypothetical protein